MKLRYEYQSRGLLATAAPNAGATAPTRGLLAVPSSNESAGHKRSKSLGRSASAEQDTLNKLSATDKNNVKSPPTSQMAKPSRFSIKKK
jgi:hypothetical protein